MQQLSSKNRLSISNFTFDKDTCTISFYSTKTNKCWSKVFSHLQYSLWALTFTKSCMYQHDFNNLKRIIKNGNN